MDTGIFRDLIEQQPSSPVWACSCSACAGAGNAAANGAGGNAPAGDWATSPTDNAYRYVDYVLQPQVQAKFAQIIGYGPVNRTAFEYVDNQTAAKLPTSPEHLATSFPTNTVWWVDNQQRIADRWQEFLLEG